MAIRKTHEQFILEMNEINPNIEILGEYINAKTKILCRCKIDGCEWMADPDHLLRGHGCPVCARKKVKNTVHKRKTHEEFVSSCDKWNPDIEVLGEYTGTLDPITCKCKKCKAVFLQIARKVSEGVGCPVCAGARVVVGINDIATTNPELIKYFKNKEDAYRYSKGSTAIVTFKCPICGYEKDMMISMVVKAGHFSCPVCADGISYPNKFSREFLRQLPVKNVEYEYSPKWAKPYSYDNYFEYNGEKYILEMDGAFHYIRYYKSNLSLDDTQRIDNIKNNLAELHNINIIRINCFYSTKDYIKKNILDSSLSNIFDLSKVDWETCDKKASTSLIEIVSNYYNAHEDMSVNNIAKHFKLQPCTISKYLYKGNEFGICNYHPRNKIPVIIKFYNQTMEFDTMNSCARYLEQTLPEISFNQAKYALYHRKNKLDNIEISYSYDEKE